jgi:uncharacterized surface protein with fasciclin (FAS1) repeats
MSLAVKSERNNQHDVHEVARYSGCLARFLTVLDAADLTNMLKGTRPITVFAPSDQAFESLPAGSVERMLKPEHRAELVNFVKNHVISGELVSEAARGKRFPRKSFAGVELTIDGHGNIAVNKAHIITADIVASNGVIHVIDAVLMPPRA